MAAVEQEVVDKIIDDLRRTHAEALDQIRTSHMDQIKQGQSHTRERIEELTKQNDGLLGAIGRLQGERDQAIKKIEIQERETRDQQAHIALKLHELNREQDNEHQELAKERQESKDEIARLKARLKRQQGKK